MFQLIDITIDIIFFSINWKKYFDRSILVISMTVLITVRDTVDPTRVNQLDVNENSSHVKTICLCDVDIQMTAYADIPYILSSPLGAVCIQRVANGIYRAGYLYIPIHYEARQQSSQGKCGKTNIGL